MKTIFQYLLLTAACAALGACQDFSDDTAFTPETPELSFVETSITAEKATKDYELSIKSNLPWRIECDKDWVSFDPSYGQGDATITVTVAANRTLDERTATISAYVIKGENVTLPVTQAAASASDLATHYYVKTDGSADKDGLTWETATTLANAIDQAMNGDVIHVAAGSYVPSVPLTGMKTALDNTREYLESYLSAYGFTGDELNAAVEEQMAQAGYTEETLMDSAELNDVLNFLYERATANVSVTEDEVKAAFDEKVAKQKESYASVDTFINDYVASNLDYISRIAGLLLVGGEMEKIREVAASVPVWLVNADEAVAPKYAAANEPDSNGRNGSDLIYYNQAHPLQQVIVTEDENADLADMVHRAYYDLFITAMRIPVVKANLYTASTLYSDYKWNQAPYSLADRNPIINGVTPDGIHVVEHQEERFSDYKAANGEYVTTWYEFLPEEVLNNTADEHSIPLLLCNHGGGDDPVQAVDELGWLKLAGEERIAIIAQRHTSEIPGSSIFDGSPFDTMSNVLPQMVRYMLETYPALDPSRVYVSGYSMGGSCTNRAVYGDASVFAAAVNMSGTPYTHTEGQDEQFKTLDIPMMLTTCTYDTYTDFDAENGIIAEDFQMNINDYLTYNEMDTVTFDFETYPMSGFKGDVYRETMVNDEYPLYSWFFLNDEGAPMVGLSIIEFIPHGLYQEYANIAWDYMKHFSRDPETLEIAYCPY